MLEYEKFLIYYANHCKICKGARCIKDPNRGWIACACQEKASIKWRFEQINIIPASLKYKNWEDWKGLILDRDNKTIGSLDPVSAMEARDKAFSYCFESTDLNLAKDRKSNLKILNRLRDGKNLIIAGDKCSGRSLLATLIIKEAVYATTILNVPVTFKWIRFSELIRAARWDSDKEIDHDFLHNSVIKHFLVIDDIEDLSKGKTSPPDIAEMDSFFQERSRKRLPTIFIFPLKYYKNKITDSLQLEDVERRLGSCFVNTVTHPKNVVITLYKKREITDE